jgi:hypothetical protein
MMRKYLLNTFAALSVGLFVGAMLPGASAHPDEECPPCPPCAMAAEDISQNADVVRALEAIEAYEQQVQMPMELQMAPEPMLAGQDDPDDHHEAAAEEEGDGDKAAPEDPTFDP